MGGEAGRDGGDIVLWDAFGYGNPHSGIARCAAYLLPHLKDQGLAPQVLDAAHPLTPKHPLAWRFKPVWIESVAERLLRAAWPDGKKPLFHAQSNFNLSGRKTFGARFRTLLTVHDVIPLLEGSSRAGALAVQMRFYLGRALRCADAVHCISAWTRDCLEDLYPWLAATGKVRVIPNGIIPLQTASLLLAPPDPLQIIFISRFEAYKGFATFLAVARRVAAAGGQAILVTDDAGLAFARSHADDLLVAGSLAVFVGVTQDDLHALLRESSVLVHPSRHEGFCLPAMEAMSHGIPVVYRAGSGIDDVVGEAGLGLPANEGVDAWFDAVIRAASWRASPEFAQRLTRHVAGKMSWADVATALRKLYTEI